MQHAIQCTCFRCTYGEEAFRAKMQLELTINGFIVDGHMNDCKSPNNVNVISYGLPENFGHPNIQLCFRLPKTEITALFLTIIWAIKAGKKFEAGIGYPGLFEHGEIKFINVLIDCKKVLRVLVPDKNGKYPPGPYGDQLTKTGIENN